MIDFANAVGLGAVALAAAMLVAIVLAPRLSRRATLSVAGLLALALLCPVAGLPAAAYLRGAVGDLSVSSLLLLVEASGSRLGFFVAAGRRQRDALLVLVLIAAGVLYPLALGAGAWDPYRLGYGDPWFLGLLLILALLAVRRQWSLAALAISLPVLGWAAGIYESTNAWDYLIDPLLALYALFAGLARGVALLRRRGTQTPPRV